MPAQEVLTTGSVLKCAHAGDAGRKGGSKLRVGTAPVLLTASFVGEAVACVPTGSDPKCTAVTVVSPGSTRLTVGGEPVLTAGLAATTLPNGVPLGTVTAVQTRLRAA